MIETPEVLTGVRIAGYDDVVYLPLTVASIKDSIRRRGGMYEVWREWRKLRPYFRYIPREQAQFHPGSITEFRLSQISAITYSFKPVPHENKAMAWDGYLREGEIL